MKTIKKILIVLVLIMATAVILMVVFRDPIKVLAVKRFAERWTGGLLEGSSLSPEEKEDICRKVGEFYGLAVEKVIPEKSINEIWRDGFKNLGFAYFYLRNYFTEMVKNSDMDALAREKGIATVNKFLGYIKDGRVREKHLADLLEKVRIFDIGRSTVKSMEQEEIDRAVRQLNDMNGELEAQGPGEPRDPLAEFSKIVERIDRLLRKHKPADE